MYMCIYIYICIERETYIYIYIYTCVYIYIEREIDRYAVHCVLRQISNNITQTNKVTTIYGRKPTNDTRCHRSNRNPQPQPQTFSEFVVLV